MTLPLIKKVKSTVTSIKMKINSDSGPDVLNAKLLKVDEMSHMQIMKGDREDMERGNISQSVGGRRATDVRKLLWYFFAKPGKKVPRYTISKAITHCGEKNGKLSVKVWAGKVYFRPSTCSQRSDEKDERTWI